MEVIAATSFDERFDAQNVVDPDLSKFWVTTGLFPQELVIEARGGTNLGEVRMVTIAQHLPVSPSALRGVGDWRAVEFEHSSTVSAVKNTQSNQIH